MTGDCRASKFPRRTVNGIFKVNPPFFKFLQRSVHGALNNDNNELSLKFKTSTARTSAV